MSSTDMADVPARRNPMAADTDPTDEELALVMREARELAMARKVESDAWLLRQVAEAVRAATEHSSEA